MQSFSNLLLGCCFSPEDVKSRTFKKIVVCGEWFEAGMQYPGFRVPVRQNFAKIENETLFLTIGLNYQRECIQI